MDILHTIAQRKIQEAIQRGEFDDLALEGLPPGLPGIWAKTGEKVNGGRDMITKPMIFLFVLVSLLLPVTSLAADCEPTREDYLGPFYTPDAPQRNRLGTGYVLAGTVRSVKGCRPLHGAKVEVWQTGPDGRYADAYRAILIADDQGHYRLETTRPPPYGGRPAHIHLRISADGHRTLATQHYPNLVQTQVELDLVLSLQTDKE